MEASIASQLDVERERVDARQAVPKTADLPSGRAAVEGAEVVVEAIERDHVARIAER